MALLPFGEWLPDGPAFGNPGSVIVTNVVPRSVRGYGPFLSPVPYAAALPSAVFFLQVMEAVGLKNLQLDNGD